MVFTEFPGKTEEVIAGFEACRQRVAADDLTGRGAIGRRSGGKSCLIELRDFLMVFKMPVEIVPAYDPIVFVEMEIS